jgi:hypothetical protein
LDSSICKRFCTDLKKDSCIVGAAGATCVGEADPLVPLTTGGVDELFDKVELVVCELAFGEDEADEVVFPDPVMGAGVLIELLESKLEVDRNVVGPTSPIL